MNICKHKLNNSVIIPFHKDAETFLNYIAWHKNTSGGACSNVWTPFSDQQSEGSFLNMNNNATVEFQFWDKTEPNGGRVENYAVIDIPRAALDDVPRSWISCSSCLLSSSMLLKLDGLCKDSVIGNFKIKETILNLKSYFHTQTTSTRSWIVNLLLASMDGKAPTSGSKSELQKMFWADFSSQVWQEW